MANLRWDRLVRKSKEYVEQVEEYRAHLREHQHKERLAPLMRPPDAGASRGAYSVATPISGGVLPGMAPPGDEKTPPEPKPVAVQIMRWFGTAILWGVLGTYMNSDGATKNLKTNLNQQAIVWATAGAAHAVPHVQGTQPKELCIQQYVLMAATAAACLAAADGVDETA